MSKTEVVLCSPVRTAIGTYGGTLKDIPAADLGTVVIKETLNRAGLAPDKIQSVVMGNVVQAGGKMNTARQATINAGLPVSAPALTEWKWSTRAKAARTRACGCSIRTAARRRSRETARAAWRRG